MLSIESMTLIETQELYNLPAPQDNAAALRQWRDKVNYVRNQIGPQDRPDPCLLAKWLYAWLKRHPLMRRHVDKIKDAPANSEVTTFEWLWNKLEQCLHESQQEANALSIQEALRKGPAKKPAINAESTALAALKRKEERMAKVKGNLVPMEKATTESPKVMANQVTSMLTQNLANPIHQDLPNPKT